MIEKSIFKDGANKNLTHPNKEKGITLIALVVTIVVLLILAGVSIAMLTGENGIIKRAQDAKKESQIGEESEKVKLAAIAAKQKTNWGEITEENLKDELDVNIGTRDEDYLLTVDGNKFVVKYLDTNRSYIVEANGRVTMAEDGDEDTGKQILTDSLGIVPSINLEEMTPVKYDETTGKWVEANPSVQGDWFDYSADVKKWANVETENGYFVYIPRYAYKITSGYHESSSTAGTMAVVFLNKDNTLKITTDSEGNTVSEADLIHASEVTSSVDETDEEVKTGGKNATTNYVIHPAFEAFDTADKKVEGIWVAKYEMSMEETIDGGTTWNAKTIEDFSVGDILTKEDSTKKMVSKSGVSPWVMTHLTNAFKNCYDMNRNLDSHMMKNTEWGAVVYLGVSQYGKGATTAIEHNEAFLTGYGASGTLSTGAASTTGNMYGVFDMAGGIAEYVAGYLDYTMDEDSENYLACKNLIIANAQYKDVYQININEDGTTSDVYTTNNLKVGDAIWEISNDSNTWFSNSLTTINVGSEVYARGRSSWMTDPSTGIFYVEGSRGNGGDNRGFRVVCVVI